MFRRCRSVFTETGLKPADKFRLDFLKHADNVSGQNNFDNAI